MTTPTLSLALGLAGAVAVTPAHGATREVTRYCLGPCRLCRTSGLTATGTRTARGLAVSPRERGLLGSRWRVGGRTLVVDDLGGGVRPGTFDVRGGSHAANRRFGRRRVRVWRVK